MKTCNNSIIIQISFKADREIYSITVWHILTEIMAHFNSMDQDLLIFSFKCQTVVCTEIFPTVRMCLMFEWILFNKIVHHMSNWRHAVSGSSSIVRHRMGYNRPPWWAPVSGYIILQSLTRDLRLSIYLKKCIAVVFSYMT